MRWGKHKLQNINCWASCKSDVLEATTVTRAVGISHPSSKLATVSSKLYQWKIFEFGALAKS